MTTKSKGWGRRVALGALALAVVALGSQTARAGLLETIGCDEASARPERPPVPHTDGLAPQTPPPAPRPRGERELARKKEGIYVTGLPFVIFDRNDGFGGGARLFFYDNGPRARSTFRTLPYLYRVYLQTFLVESGTHRHALNFDLPCVARGALRLRAHLYYTRSDNENHFGIGSVAMKPLAHPGAPEGFATFSAYRKSALGLTPSGETHASHSKYGVTQPGLLLTSQLRRCCGPLLPLLGFELRHTDVHDFTGEATAARDAAGAGVEAPQAPTRLREDCLAGRLRGCGGGWDNVLRVGLSLDTRDYEPNPTRGLLVDAVLDVGTRALGGNFAYTKLLVAPHLHTPIGPEWLRLVAVGRGVLQWASEGTPFYALPVLAFTGGTRTGLGGLTTLRGYRLNRFVGPVATMANAELRWTFVRGTLLRQDLALMLVPSFDTGRVYDELSEIGLAGWRSNYGGALRVAWNQATIITLDTAFSREDRGLYLNFGHPL